MGAVSVDILDELFCVDQPLPSHASSVGEWGDLSNGAGDAAIAGVVVRDVLLPSSASWWENRLGLPGR
jgi:hypothetical protein